MSGLLTSLLDELRLEYVRRMENSDFAEPYLTAERLCHEQLYLETDQLAEIIEQDPTLLAARADNLIKNRQERVNPAVGIVVCSNIVAAAMEGLLAIAVERDWLEMDEDGAIIVNDEELQEQDYSIEVDYSISETAKRNISLGGRSELSKLLAAAESAFLDRVSNSQNERDCYQYALDISSDYSVFAPEDIAPLVAENPLLLGLRPEELIEEDLFEGDPPAGLIISAHLTRMMLHQLLELGVEHGLLVLDSSGHIVVPDEPQEPPTIH